MINIIKELINFKGDKLIKDFLIDISLFEIFEKLYEEDWVDNPTFESLIKYIVSVYSVDSPCVIIGADWLSFKKQQFNKSNIPQEFYELIVLLKSRNIVSCIKEWLEYQQNDTYGQLCMLKDLRAEMQISAVGRIVKASSEVDYDQKFKNAKYSIDLLEMIKTTEQQLLQNDPRMKEGYQEIKKATNNKVFVSPETFAK